MTTIGEEQAGGVGNVVILTTLEEWPTLLSQGYTHGEVGTLMESAALSSQAFSGFVVWLTWSNVKLRD